MHTKISEHLCSCGAMLRTKAKLGRHVQKWNAKHELRDVGSNDFAFSVLCLQSLPV